MWATLSQEHSREHIYRYFDAFSIQLGGIWLTNFVMGAMALILNKSPSNVLSWSLGNFSAIAFR